MSDYMMSDYDPYLLAQQVGQEYNPYQGYPLKQVSDQIWDVYGPTPDYLIAQQFGMMFPNRDEFSTDTLYGADPLLRGPLAEALGASEGDSTQAYDYLQSEDYQNRQREEIGRTEWDALVQQGDLRSIAAVGSEERDQAGVDYYNRGLEELLAAGSPSAQRNMSMYDFIAERQGGMPTPGAGTTPYDDGAGGDALAALAGPTIPDDNAALDTWRGGPVVQPTGQQQARTATPDLDATRAGSDAGPIAVGEAPGPDRVSTEGGVRYAVIDGVRYELPDTMTDASGSNPYYNRQLRSVMQQRGDRIRKDSGYGEDDDGGGLSRDDQSYWQKVVEGQTRPFGPAGEVGGAIKRQLDRIPALRDSWAGRLF